MNVIQLEHVKNTAYELPFPMESQLVPGEFLSGETVADEGYYNDGGGWLSLAITDTVAEIGSTGVYELSLAQGELNHDMVAIKFTSTDGRDLLVIFTLTTARAVAGDQMDLQDTPNATALAAAADALLNRDMSTGTDSGSPTVRTVRQALRFLRNKWSIAGTTLTVTKEDDSTASWTGTVSTDASAEPVTGNDPASA